ncbi:MAG: arginine--tRNA ligase [Gammaproteobacteria bacterium]|nr:arginine--tRNA ligase [Gammaproteobacteria bacterium]
MNQKIIEVMSMLGHPVEDGLVLPSFRPDLSDYQSNIAMSWAKKLKTSPITLAHKILKVLSDIPEISKISVDGPGFINMSISENFLINNLKPALPKISHKKIVIDYGGANIAKEMHVGHLRSAIIGESIKRIMQSCGDEVIADVHLGDWGTPMGMLIAQLKKEQPELVFFKNHTKNLENISWSMNIAEISALYKRAAKNFKENDDFKEQARIATYQLQNGDAGYIALWKILKAVSLASIRKSYDKLLTTFDYWLGESDVNDLLPQMLSDLLKRKIAVESEGAIVIFLSEKENRTPPPLLLKKSDGAYTYAATDLATILQRGDMFHPDAILYVVDARQKEHFEQVFEAARLAGYVKPEVSLEHLAFGTINGKDGKPFKTRTGEAMKLKDLLNLAKDCARANLPKTSKEFSQRTLNKQAEQIAIASIKYQDLKNNRVSNYIFDTENFIKSEGKTGPYLLYAVARINSILAKAKVKNSKITDNILITHPIEREILLILEKQPEILEDAYTRREPSVISEYVYLLAQKFSTFYAECPVIQEKDQRIRNSRLTLIKFIKNTLLYHLNLLAIEAPEKMLKDKS